MKRLLTIGNVTIDVFLEHNGAEVIQHHFNNQQYSAFPEGQKTVVSHVFYASGGGGANSAVCAKRQGLNPILCSIRADDCYGKMIETVLNSEGVNQSLMVVSSSGQTASSYILPSPSKNPAILTHRGTFHTKATPALSKILYQQIDGIYISSFPVEWHSKLVDFLKNPEKRAALTVYNPGTSQLYQSMQSVIDVIGYASIVICNHFETTTILRSQKTLNNTWGDYRDACLSFGPHLWIVTDGDKGLYVLTKEEILFYTALQVQSKTTVGAGDAFSATFTAFLLQDATRHQAIMAGIINSASVVQSKSSQDGLLTRHHLDLALHRHSSYQPISIDPETPICSNDGVAS